MRPISFATPPSSEPGAPAPRPSKPASTPSFEIRGATSQGAGTIRWDQIDSGQVLKRARRVYFHYVEQCPAGSEPLGIVLQLASSQGRVVFETPVLLPEEQFVPLDLIRVRSGRPRAMRGPQRS